MKRLIYIFALLLLSIVAYCNGGATGKAAIAIKKDNGSIVYYQTGGDWDHKTGQSNWISGYTTFKGYDFGFVSALEIKGLSIVGWAEGSDWIATKAEYSVYKEGNLSPELSGSLSIGHYGDAKLGKIDVNLESGNDDYVRYVNYSLNLIDSEMQAGKYDLKVKQYGSVLYNNNGYSGSYNEVSYGYHTATFTVLPTIDVLNSISFDRSVRQKIEVKVGRTNKIFVELDGVNKSNFILGATEYDVVNGVAIVTVTMTTPANNIDAKLKIYGFDYNGKKIDSPTNVDLVYKRDDSKIQFYVVTDKYTNTAYLYTWNGVSTGNWPGKKMTYVTKVGNKYIYSYQFDRKTILDKTMSVIVNNGSGTQTSDIHNVGPIKGDVVFELIDNKSLTNLSGTITSTTSIASTIYGNLTYQKTISGEDVNKWHWISLPFDVKISDINGGVFGKDFIIREYDTEARSRWISNIASENKSAWRDMESTETLLAGKGYILAVDDTIQSVTLNFKSLEALNIIKNQFDGNNINCSFNVPESANWHLIGTGLYGAANSFGGVDYVAIPQGNDYQYYNLSNDGLANINAYTAFFVQHAGGYSFSKEAQIRNSAPRRIMDEDIVEHYYVSIGSGENAVNTAIFMAEDGTDNYVVGQDFLHLGASGESLQFYSKQGKNDLAFNYLKKEERTIALGGYVAEAGKYTISLTADGKASSVILYDSQTGEATDLLQYDYEFDAEKGYLDGRFDITIAYAAQDDTPTDVEIGGNDRLVVLNSDGIVTFEGLAIGEEVVIYDIMGRCVNHFVASNDVANVMLADGVYVMKHSSEIIKFVVNR